MNLVTDAYEYFAYGVGKYGIIVSSLLFALATVSCQYYYGIESLNYITNKNFAKKIFTVIFCITIVIGAIIPMSLMWQISDLALCLMTVFNLICLLILRKEI